jgi:hypothetical protein
LHPNTLVLARPTSRPTSAYDRDPFLGFEEALNSGRFTFFRLDLHRPLAALELGMNNKKLRPLALNPFGW